MLQWENGLEVHLSFKAAFNGTAFLGLNGLYTTESPFAFQISLKWTAPHSDSTSIQTKPRVPVGFIILFIWVVCGFFFAFNHYRSKILLECNLLRFSYAWMIARNLSFAFNEIIHDDSENMLWAKHNLKRFKSIPVKWSSLVVTMHANFGNRRPSEWKGNVADLFRLIYFSFLSKASNQLLSVWWFE